MDHIAMRWAVFFLFIFNALIFIWFMFQEESGIHANAGDSIEIFDFSRVERVSLLGELDAADLTLRDVRRVNATDSINGDASVCALVGPFLEVISARQVKGRLEEKGVEAKTVLILKELPAVSWVYIAPQPDRKKALALLRELQQKNIESFLIADGEYENGISLGFFSSPESAKKVLEERATQGYPVSMTEKKREQKTYWLAFGAGMLVKLDSVPLEGLAEGGYALKKQEKSCDEVALLQVIE